MVVTHMARRAGQRIDWVNYCNTRHEVGPNPFHAINDDLACAAVPSSLARQMYGEITHMSPGKADLRPEILVSIPISMTPSRFSYIKHSDQTAGLLSRCG